jgi:hypothetical protein
MGQIPSHIRLQDDWRAEVKRRRANMTPLVLMGLTIGVMIAFLAAGHLPI